MVILASTLLKRLFILGGSPKRLVLIWLSQKWDIPSYYRVDRTTFYNTHLSHRQTLACLNKRGKIDVVANAPFLNEARPTRQFEGRVAK